MNDFAALIVVRFDSARSAEPPHSSGSSAASALMTLPDAARVETSLPASKTGSASSMPSGSSPACEPVEQRLALGVRGGPRVERRLPLGVRARRRARRASRVCAMHVVGDDEGLLGVEAEHLLRRGELVGAERGAVDLAGVLLAGGRPADDRLQDDDRRLVGLALGGLDRGVQLGDVLDVLAGLLPVDRLHVPAVRLVARRRRPR